MDKAQSAKAILLILVKEVSRIRIIAHGPSEVRPAIKNATSKIGLSANLSDKKISLGLMCARSHCDKRFCSNVTSTTVSLVDSEPFNDTAQCDNRRQSYRQRLPSEA